MESEEVKRFLDAAKAYCELIDSSDSFHETKSLSKMLKITSQIYTKALSLPDVDLEEKQSIEVDFPMPEVDFKEYNAYLEMFNPYQDKNPVYGSLNDDIKDIYGDIKRGLILYEKGQKTEAIWEWKFGLEMHWGEHAISVMRALHSINYQNNGNENGDCRQPND